MKNKSHAIEAVDALNNYAAETHHLECNESPELPQRCPWDDWHPITDVAQSIAS